MAPGSSCGQVAERTVGAVPRHVTGEHGRAGLAGRRAEPVPADLGLVGDLELRRRARRRRRGRGRRRRATSMARWAGGGRSVGATGHDGDGLADQRARAGTAASVDVVDVVGIVGPVAGSGSGDGARGRGRGGGRHRRLDRGWDDRRARRRGGQVRIRRAARDGQGGDADARPAPARRPAPIHGPTAWRSHAGRLGLSARVRRVARTPVPASASAPASGGEHEGDVGVRPRTGGCRRC